ncbi:hypothetical protein ACXN5S_11400 [Pseudoroseicyclus sp. H15]
MAKRTTSRALKDAISHKDVDELWPSNRDRLVPVVYAGGMVALGAAMLAAEPWVGEVPEAKLSGDDKPKGLLRKSARMGRDGAQALAPTNVTDSIGRSLLIGGIALLLTRILDEIVGRGRR